MPIRLLTVEDLGLRGTLAHAALQRQLRQMSVRRLAPAPGLHARVHPPNGRVGHRPIVSGIGLCLAPVSYTHLTLPTICSVQISVVAVSLKKKNNSYQIEESRLLSKNLHET
eukprot:TRINITY_DN6466_c0_g1_i1.p1 TRINITY_DN6466_c0_g1~~TRINITY_DN6466_c0_g1_i1.p1  ORF type:complete len:112 (-),score=6.87 TRINITY_DN6466_c0_g1_i1:18-353(-)